MMPHRDASDCNSSDRRTHTQNKQKNWKYNKLPRYRKRYMQLENEENENISPVGYDIYA